MDLLVLFLVVVLVMILAGVLLGKLSWDRAIILTLVTLVVAAAIHFLLGGALT